MRWTLLWWTLSLNLALAAVPGVPVYPVRQAQEAWVELQAQDATNALHQLELLSPRGRLEWVTGLPAARTSPPLARLHLPVVPFGWTVFQVQWLPVQDGAVTLTLTASRELATNQLLWRQEVAFDDLRVTGTLLMNPSFEQYTGNRPVAWEGGGVVNAGPLPPYHEANYARVWAERPLRQLLHVRSNVPVTLRLAARAMPVLGPDALRPLADRNSLAHQAAAFYKRGINLNRFLELPPGDKTAEACTEEDWAQMKHEGFDHVRLPVAWHHHAGPAPAFTLNPAFLRQVDQVASNALSQGLFVILSMVPPADFHARPQSHTNQFFALWRQLAMHYAAAHPGLALELLHEARQAATTEVLNGWYAQVLKIIRGANPMRTVFLGPGAGGGPEELVHLRLPPEEENVIVTIHCREPRYFTLQSHPGAEAEIRGLRGVVYPGPPAAPLPVPAGASEVLRQWLEEYHRRPMAHNPSSRAVVESQLQLARDWSAFYARPVQVGAFGVSTAADTLSRTRYCREVRQLAEGYGLGWAFEAWQGGFNYWDRLNRRPWPGMREALFVQ